MRHHLQLASQIWLGRDVEEFEASVLTVRPNPAQSRAYVALHLDRILRGRVEILDSVGRVITVLHDGPLKRGRQTFVLDGALLPNGVYLVRFIGDKYSAVEMITFVH